MSIIDINLDAVLAELEEQVDEIGLWVVNELPNTQLELTEGCGTESVFCGIETNS